jgi:hypothetical protein
VQQDELAEGEKIRAQLQQQYERAVSRYREVQREVGLLEENLEDISFGLYKPHFDFQTPDEYRRKLEETREYARLMVREGRAAVCKVKWTVGNSAKVGEKMTRQYTKLLLRAFNGECDAAVANVSWNNITKMEERLRKALLSINDLGSVMQMHISPEYFNLRCDELRLTHEYEQKRYEEREEQRQIRERLRDQEKAQREIEKAREEAEREEARNQRALERAREEAAKATGVQLQQLTEQIAGFESKLDEARRNKERAISRAQLTKSGFVYVISNVGSFGERVYKIGMTRRMEPMERIAELGDASVPFPFDLHVMLYSDNAPELEASLHQLFSNRRVNLVNARKEFYRDVELEEIEAFMRERGLSAQFIRQAEAREHRESISLRQERLAEPSSANRFDEPLFQTAGAGR